MMKVDNVSKLATTYHFRVERAERMYKIDQYIGLGNPIKETYKDGRYWIISDTGVIYVLSDNRTIITAYAGSFAQVVRIYGGRNKIPKQLEKRINQNMSKGYTTAGW